MAEPSRPAVTAPQIAGILMAGVPIVAQLLHVFGVFDLTLAQQAALGNIIQWATIGAGALFASDAGLRAARNHAHARVAQSRVWREPAIPPLTPTNPPLAPEPKPRAKPAARPKRIRDRKVVDG